MLLLQGDNWNDLLHSAAEERCVIPGAGGCGGTAVAVVFFYTFILIASLILLNLFVAVSGSKRAQPQ